MAWPYPTPTSYQRPPAPASASRNDAWAGLVVILALTALVAGYLWLG